PRMVRRAGACARGAEARGHPRRPHTLGGYFDPDAAPLRLTKDLGRDPMPYPPNVIETVRTHWAYDFVGVAERWTPVSRAFAWVSWEGLLSRSIAPAARG